MVKMKSKIQSCKEACNWLRSHTWDCEPANGIQAELGLLLRGVACNRVSWVFSLSHTVCFLLTHSISPAASSAFALIDSFPPSSSPPHRSLPAIYFCTCTCAEGEGVHVGNLLNILCSLLFVRAVEILYMKQCVCTCSCMAALT